PPGNFLARHWPRLLAIFAVVIAPCLWHAHIEAGDLASHVYNAWLAHLIRTGQAPGLTIAAQWNNVLFDVLLEHAVGVVGFSAAERLVTSLAVLIFFWGAFTLVRAITAPQVANSRVPHPRKCEGGSDLNANNPDKASHNPHSFPWVVLPCLAMFA